jgi:hypothetical protein
MVEDKVDRLHRLHLSSNANYYHNQSAKRGRSESYLPAFFACAALLPTVVRLQ